MICRPAFLSEIALEQRPTNDVSGYGHEPMGSIITTKGKVVSVLNYAPCREDIQKSENIAPDIINLITKWE
jgi:hypothetical protein